MTVETVTDNHKLPFGIVSIGQLLFMSGKKITAPVGWTTVRVSGWMQVSVAIRIPCLLQVCFVVSFHHLMEKCVPFYSQDGRFINSPSFCSFLLPFSPLHVLVLTQMGLSNCCFEWIKVTADVADVAEPIRINGPRGRKRTSQCQWTQESPEWTGPK